MRTFRLVPSLALLLCLCIIGTDLAAAATPAAPLEAATTIHKLHHHGVGKGVKITEPDGSVIKGKIVSIDADSFQLQPKHGAPLQLAYTQVSAVNGPGLSKGAKIGIGVAAGIGIFVIIVAIALRNDGYAHDF